MIREFNNPELAPRNSFHVAQRAARLIEFDRTEDLQELFEKGMPDPWYVLGGGNNVLFTQDYPGTLLTPVAQGIRIVDEQPDCVTIEADAGVEWDDLVEWAVQHELWGLENLALIPGKVGAAPVQNIGAYGCEAKDAIRSVEMFCTETFNTLVLNREHCAFGYRDSVFKRFPAGTCNHHFGPLCVEPHAPTPPRIRGPGRRGRSAGRHHAAQHPRGRLCDPPGQACPTLR